MELPRDQLRLEGLGGRWSRLAAGVSAVGLLGTLLVTWVDQPGAQRVYLAYLVNFMFFLSLALGALFFVLIAHLTRAGWSVALRRLAEVFAWMLLPLSAAGLVLLVGMGQLYEWSHADAVAADPLLQHKQAWLNPSFFVVRFVCYFLAWNLLAGFFLRRSLQQDRSGDAELTLQLERVAAPGMIVYAMTLTFAVFDWMMSLNAHWYSTIYGVYYFAGGVLGFFSLVPLVLYALQRAGKLTSVINAEHYHDMGKLMFAFVVFWAYIAFSQYMLIWYTNIPEETLWYKVRQTGSWVGLSLLLLFGHFIVPFLWLMSRHIKRRRAVLVLAAAWLLLMHWCDLYYLIMPESSPHGVPLHLLDLTIFLFLGGALLAATLWRLGRVELVPIRDPRLEESLGFENV